VEGRQELIERVERALMAMQRHSWEQGVTAQALLELGHTAWLVPMAREVVNRQGPDGRLALNYNERSVTDTSSNGEALLWAARHTGDPALAAAAQRQLDWLLRQAPRVQRGPAPGTLHHILDKPQVWVDSFYMAPPFLAAAGEHAEAVRQVEGFHATLWQPERRMYAHIWDESTQAFERAACWGVGNGWAAAGMARVIRALPPNMEAERQRLIALVRNLLDGCLAHLRPDGLFHDVVDDPNTFVETNLSQMLAYTIYRGVKGGWLGAELLDTAARMRAAAEAKVDVDGLVQGVCGAPHFDHAGFAPEGQAFFLLMEAAARDWEQAQAG
jgi:rhamnogalacturonyl hydrolase YesR